MTPEQIAALTNESLIDAIVEWADTVQDAILACRNWANYPKALALHRLRLKNAEQTFAALRAEALRRMDGNHVPPSPASPPVRARSSMIMSRPVWWRISRAITRRASVGTYQARIECA